MQHLGAYHFDGDAETLQTAYKRLLSTFPPDAVSLNLCVVRENGITVIDACPTLADFESFSAGDEFAAMLNAADLPVPRIESFGELCGTQGSMLVQAD